MLYELTFERKQYATMFIEVPEGAAYTWQDIAALAPGEGAVRGTLYDLWEDVDDDYSWEGEEATIDDVGNNLIYEWDDNELEFTEYTPEEFKNGGTSFEVKGKQKYEVKFEWAKHTTAIFEVPEGSTIEDMCECGSLTDTAAHNLKWDQENKPSILYACRLEDQSQPRIIIGVRATGHTTIAKTMNRRSIRFAPVG